MPEISVLVPVYNVEPYLTHCVDSILAQTFTDFELILVDDGSTDGSGSLCDACAARDARVRVIHQENRGVSSARNVCLQHMTGNCLAFIDSDDWVHPRYLERLYEAMTRHGTMISACGFIQTAEENQPFAETEFRTECRYMEDYWVENHVRAIVLWGKLYRKEAFEGISFPEGEIHEDEYNTWRVLFRYDRIACVRAEMYYYFQRPSSIMHSPWTTARLYGEIAAEEQLRFFKRNGMQKAWKCSMTFLIYRISEDVREAALGQFPCRKKLLRKLRRKLIRYGKKVEMTNRSVPWLYEQAFPLETKVWRGLRLKFGRKALREWWKGKKH